MCADILLLLFQATIIASGVTKSPSAKDEAGHSATSPEDKSTSGMLRLGARVVLHSLKSVPQHNGRKGTVLGRAADKPDRWRVQCDDALGEAALP